MYLYGIDTNDANLYDIVLHIDNLNVADAVSILTDVARLPPFQGMDESKKILEDQYIAASVKAALIETLPSVEVKCKEGVVLVTTESPLNQSDTISELIGGLPAQIDGLKDVRINLIPTDMD